MTRASEREFNQAQRVLDLLQYLERRSWVTVGELRQRYGISRRTVYNDFDAFEVAGIGLESELGGDGQARWRLAPTARKRTLRLAEGQIIALGLARLALSFLAGTDLHDQLGAVLDKLARGDDGSPQTTARRLARLAQKIAIVPYGPKSYADKIDILDDILDSLVLEQRLAVGYRAPGKRRREHTVEPLALLVYREALYLVAHIVREGTPAAAREPTTFAVERIAWATRKKGERFDYPAGFDPKTITNGAFGMIGDEAQADVELLFDKDQARYVEERDWHPSQRFGRAPDGRRRMRLRVSGTFGVFRWLLGHADTAEVISPPSLRAEVRNALERALARHR